MQKAKSKKQKAKCKKQNAKSKMQKAKSKKQKQKAKAKAKSKSKCLTNHLLSKKMFTHHQTRQENPTIHREDFAEPMVKKKQNSTSDPSATQ